MREATPSLRVRPMRLRGPQQVGASTLFGSGLYQPLGHEDEAENLGPLRNNVAYDLSPLAPRIHSPECYDPADSREHEENCQRMLAQEFHYRRRQYSLRLFALRRAFFVEMFGHQNGYEDARPVGNGVAEK